MQLSKTFASFVGSLLPHFCASLTCEVPHFSASNFKIATKENVSLSLFFVAEAAWLAPHPARGPQDTILLKLRPLKKKSACEIKIDNPDKRSFKRRSWVQWPWGSGLSLFFLGDS